MQIWKSVDQHNVVQVCVRSYLENEVSGGTLFSHLKYIQHQQKQINYRAINSTTSGDMCHLLASSTSMTEQLHCAT